MNKPFLLRLLHPEVGVNTILRNGRHSVIREKVWVFSTAVVRTWNLASIYLVVQALRPGEAFIKFLISHPNLAKIEPKRWVDYTCDKRQWYKFILIIELW